DNRIKKIISVQECTNPLYLRAILDEVRVFGVHEQLESKIQHYLNAQTIPELFELILERYEQDYEINRPGLVHDIMTLLWASRTGLSESDLANILGDTFTPMPKGIMSPLLLATEQNLINRSGLLMFSHDFIRKAVEQRYLKNQSQKENIHMILAKFFFHYPLNERKILELPWQIYNSDEKDQLKNVIETPEFLIKAVHLGKLSDLRLYWYHLKSKYDILQTYLSKATIICESTKDKNTYLGYLSAVSIIFNYMGRYNDSENFIGERLKFEINANTPI
ncbi:MAG: TPR repeat-containing protein, partial [Candidatus Magnetoglobus multicellularis str. Araruama]